MTNWSGALFLSALTAGSVLSAGCAGDPPKAAAGAAASTKSYAIVAQNPTSGGALITYQVDDPTVAPTGLSSVPVSAPVALSVTPNKKFLLVADSSSAQQTVKSYAIGTNAALTLSAGSNGPEGANSVAVSPSGTYVFATFPTANRAYSFALDSTVGAMSAITSAPTGIATGATPAATAFDKSGGYVYIANSGANTISAFAIGATGGLTAITGAAPTGGASGMKALKVDPTGAYLFSADYTTGTVSTFSISQTTGALSAATGPITAASGTRSLVFDSTGTHLYAVNEVAGTISQYTLNTTTGSLTSLGADVSYDTASTSGATAAAIHPTGLALFVTGATSGTIYVVGITPASGALTSASKNVVGGSPTGIVFFQLTQ